jgi:glycosyltransferase involved in cell wall biosynthesis
MKTVVIIPVKNEDWILEKTLAACSLFADHIIVSDQASWDETPLICRKFAKVTYVLNTNSYPNPENRRQLPLEHARQFGKDNIIFCLDADEIPTANILSNDLFWQNVKSLQPGEAMQLEWITLWRSISQYRTGESIWSPRLIPFVFRDNGTTNYSNNDWHEGRLPEGVGINQNIHTDVRILHFHFVLWDRMLSKQAHCRIIEKVRFQRPSLKINIRYGTTKEEKQLQLEAVPKDWLNGYRTNQISFDDFKEGGLYWYDVDVLENFQKFGATSFRTLDIWDINWEHKRIQATKKYSDRIPNSPIQDPRSWFDKAIQRGVNLMNLDTLVKAYSKFLSLLQTKR